MIAVVFISSAALWPSCCILEQRYGRVFGKFSRHSRTACRGKQPRLEDHSVFIHRGDERLWLDFKTRHLGLGVRHEKIAIKCCIEDGKSSWATSEAVTLPPSDVDAQSTSEAEMVDEDVTVVAAFFTLHSFLKVLDIARRANHPWAGARLLLLDIPGNVHSVYLKHKLVTDMYYDVLATLPPIIPEGPIGILGLGAGTVAHILDHFWPEVELHGWEHDPVVVDVARRYFDLSDLESDSLENAMGNSCDAYESLPLSSNKPGAGFGMWENESEKVRQSAFINQNRRKGKLRVHVGDALNPDVIVQGGFAGIIVDLFSDGALIPALQSPETWEELRGKLRPGGRFMVNCGGSCVESARKDKKDGGIIMQETVSAMAKVFPGEVFTMTKDKNVVALTGACPNFQTWQRSLPLCLQADILNWSSLN